METFKEDNVKRQLLDELAEEPTMVISAAYAYAKNYVNYGEDITKAWTTAVQQASITEKVRQKAWVEAYDSFKTDYENRLKADLEAILTEIQLEIEENGTDLCDDGWYLTYNNLIQQKIDKLKMESNERDADCPLQEQESMFTKDEMISVLKDYRENMQEVMDDLDSKIEKIKGASR